MSSVVRDSWACYNERALPFVACSQFAIPSKYARQHTVHLTFWDWDSAHSFATSPMQVWNTFTVTMGYAAAAPSALTSTFASNFAQSPSKPVVVR